MNISSLLPPVSTPKKTNVNSKSAAVAGTEITDNKQKPSLDYGKEKRRQRDRRQKSIKPLIDLRVSRDRRDNPDSPKINIEI